MTNVLSIINQIKWWDLFPELHFIEFQFGSIGIYIGKEDSLVEERTVRD